jgi:glycerol-3-phosphate acyltransferase PlsY
MDAAGIAWVAGGYLAGAFPSTWIVSRIRRSPELEAAVHGDAGEADAHLMTTKYLGWGWSAAASAADVLKALGFVLVARDAGHESIGVVAATGLAVVTGHSFPFFARDYAGRGMAASAGVLLVLLPIQMVVAGLIILVGIAIRMGGLGSTLGIATTIPGAAIQGQPGALVTMAGAMFVLILLRRLVGVRGVIRGGVSAGRAVLYRCLFDSSGPPASRKDPRAPRHAR